MRNRVKKLENKIGGKNLPDKHYPIVKDTKEGIYTIPKEIISLIGKDPKDFKQSDNSFFGCDSVEVDLNSGIMEEIEKTTEALNIGLINISFV